MIFVCINNSVATKNGNSEGTTDVAQRDIPDFTAFKLELENINIQIVNSKNMSDIIFLFNLKMRKLFFANI